jgi:hypothetical protein
MAERNGSALRRRLRSAERLSERAIARGSFKENTPLSRSRASLVSVTRCDQRLVFFLGTRVFLLALVGIFQKQPLRADR